MVKIFSDAEGLAQASARLFVEQSQRSIERSGKFRVVLSGGNTPVLTYHLLAAGTFRNQVDWSRVHIFWSDERCVPPADERSNYGMVQRVLLSYVGIPETQIFPIIGAQNPEAAATEYESMLRKYFGNGPAQFDLVYLGLGDDGHTASLFPGSAGLLEKERWVTVGQRGPEGPARITLTTEILNRTEMAVFLVSGEKKSEILNRVLTAKEPDPSLPAGWIQPLGGELIWFVDLSASVQLKGST